MLKNTISAQVAMAQFDESNLPDGSPKVFSLKLWDNSGKIVYIPKGIKCGVNNKDMGGTDTKGIQPVDKFIKPVGHPTPFKWYRIFEFNNMEVTL